MGKGAGGCDDRPALSIFGVSDLHLGPSQEKHHYSSKWVDHQSKLRKAWDDKIDPESLVLMPGDISWHREPDDLRYEYMWIDERPGAIKVLSPGNHDYGIWDSEADANAFMQQFATETAVMDNAIRIPNPLNEDRGLVIAAAQGSQSPDDLYFNTNAGRSAKGKVNESVRFLRELVALDQALTHAKELQQDDDDLVVMIHYPPFANGNEETVFSRMIARSGAKLCVYGHLHQQGQFRETWQGNDAGVEYRFVGADFLRFSPTKLAQLTEDGLEILPLEVDAKTAWPEKPLYYSGSSKKDKKENKKDAEDDEKGEKKDEKKERPAWVPPEGYEKILCTPSTAGATCKECGRTIRPGHVYHTDGDEFIHGGGMPGKSGTCWFKKQDDAKRAEEAAKKSKKGKKGGGLFGGKKDDDKKEKQYDGDFGKCDVCDHPIGSGKGRRPWSRHDDGSKVCADCKRHMN